MAEAAEILYLGVLAILFAIVLFVYALRLLQIADFETGTMSLQDLIDRLNSTSKFYVFVEVALLVLAVLPPAKSALLFVEVFLVLALDAVLILKGKFTIHIRWAVKNMNQIKYQGIAHLVVFFTCAVTCIVKLLL